MSKAHQTCRVAPGARTDIENAARNRRDQMDDRTVVIGKRDALVPLEQLRRLFGIVLGPAGPYRFIVILVGTPNVI
jgi:hypothetical protein